MKTLKKNRCCMLAVASLFVVLVPETSAQVQSERLYLLSLPSLDSQSPSIYLVSNTDLDPILVRSMATGDDVPTVNVDLAHRLATVLAWHPEKILVNVIDMNDPVTPLALTVETGKRTFLGANLLNSPALGLVQSFRLGRSYTRLLSTDEKYEKTDFSQWGLLTLNLSGHQVGTFESNQSINEGRYLIVSGSPGPGLGGDGAEVFVGKDGQLSISIAGRKIPLPLDSPPQELRQAKYLSLAISNDTLAAVLLGSAKKAEREDSQIFFFDKIAKTWSSLHIAADSVWVRSLGGSWVGILGGEITRDPREAGIPETAARKFYNADDRYRRDFRDSPGLSAGETAESTTAKSARDRFKSARTYAPGVLVLYNALTKQKYSIDTGQGDSELLLVDSDRVYYRVNQDIYRTTFAGGQLAEGVLIAHGEMVADVHWAFSSVR